MLRRSVISALGVLAITGLRAQQDTSGPAWPAPPERARIRHVRTIDASSGLRPDRGFLGGILGTLFGGHTTAAWLVQPVGIAVAGDGTLYVADPGARGVHIIRPAENEYDLVTATRHGPFISPVGCAVDRDGRVYVTDSERKEIVILDSDGDPEGSIAGGLERPTGIQVSGDSVFVTDAGAHRVLVFNREGDPLGAFGTRGAGASEFNFPVQLALGDSLYVLDALNYRVQSFDRGGRFGSAFGSIGNVAGRFAAPKGIALDSDGDIYVADGLMDNVQIFDRSGRLLLIFGRSGTRDGEFVMPSGIAAGPDDTIYVVDSVNRRIQVFRYLR
jgi:DNA-binding beta-propeller fold protein YncE